MGCEEGEPVCDKVSEPDMVCEAWVSCEQWCGEVEGKGPQALNLECLATAEASTCLALEDACAY